MFKTKLSFYKPEPYKFSLLTTKFNCLKYLRKV